MFSVRDAKPEDSTVIASIEEGNFSDPWSKDNIEGFILSEHTLSLVIFDRENGDEIIGHILTTYAGESFPEGGESEIDTFAIANESKGRGAGKRLLEEYFKRLSELNIKKTALEVRVSNEAAINIYKKYGFRTVNTRKNFYKDPDEDAYIMVREEND